VIAVLVVALLLAGAAAAYFTASGSGSGSGTVGNPAKLTISAGVNPSQPLFPGTTGDVTVHITNPNTFAIHIGTIALDTSQGTAGSGYSGPSGCDPPPLTFTSQTNGGTGWTVPAHSGVDGVLDLDLTNSILLATTAANACQGGSFTVYLQTGP
jgi:hypothetical protein